MPKRAPSSASQGNRNPKAVNTALCPSGRQTGQRPNGRISPIARPLSPQSTGSRPASRQSLESSPQSRQSTSSTNSFENIGYELVHTYVISNLPKTTTQRDLAQTFRKYVLNFKLVSLTVNKHKCTAYARAQTPNATNKLTKILCPALQRSVKVQEQGPKAHEQVSEKQQHSYSCIIKGVDHDYKDDEVLFELQRQNHEIKSAWRITDRRRQVPTMKFRVITFCENTLDILLTRGAYIFHRRYNTETSRNPRPQAIQCQKCLKFGHPTLKCKEKEQICARCSGNHEIRRCQANITTPKCNNCGEGHVAYSAKCKQRPEQAGPHERRAPIRVLDGPTAPPLDTSGTETIKEAALKNDVIRLTTSLLWTLLQDRREEIAEAVGEASKQLFGRKVKITQVGSGVHITVIPINQDTNNN